VNRLQKFQALFGRELEKPQRVIDETHEDVQKRARMNNGIAPIGARVDWRELQVRNAAVAMETAAKRADLARKCGDDWKGRSVYFGRARTEAGHAGGV
jgi:hypothetical protein